MNSANMRFRVWDCVENRYCGSGGDKIFMLAHDGELVFWSARDGKHRAADKSRFVVEMCTGLEDENGFLIYEGDIIERRDAGFEGKYFRRAIYFVPHYARFYEMRPGSGVSHPLDADSAAECRVIGNTKENRDLIGLALNYKRFGRLRKWTQQ